MLIILRQLARSPFGFQSICDTFEDKEVLSNAFNLIIYGLTYDGSSKYIFKELLKIISPCSHISHLRTSYAILHHV